MSVLPHPVINTATGATVSNLNAVFGSRLRTLGLCVPEVLLPSPGTDLGRWAVVACDQYTSDENYWDVVDGNVGSAPSSLRVVLPEVYLGRADVPQRVERIHGTMQGYLREGVLASLGECFVYVRRTTARSGLREGLVVAVDLERYDYSARSKSLIRATEGTIVERIPPRLAVRSAAVLELPHIMVLMEDADQSVIEGLGERCGSLEPLYDVELMCGGGRVQGYRVAERDDIARILTGFEALLERAAAKQNTETPLMWAMGDGNHSLATAKANWEEMKQALLESGSSRERVFRHPARWALVEVVNIHSPGLRFEPIHRAIFTAQRDQLSSFLRGHDSVKHLEPIAEAALRDLLSGPSGQDKAGYFDGESFFTVHWQTTSKLPPASVDGFFEDLRRGDPSARIDFIHGWEETRKLGTAGAAAFFVPVIGRESLFGYVQESGPLPRKAFSMGDAEEKRYYMEARRITT